MSRLFSFVVLLSCFFVLPAPRANAAVLITNGSSWKYFIGTQEASTPVNAWRQLGFVDSAWQDGITPIGYAVPANDPGGYEATIRTTLPTSTDGNYSSVFLRKTFVVSNPADFTQLRMDVVVDDGYIIWVNGSEIGRYNAPAGEPAFNSFASGAFEATATTVRTNNLSNFLVAGNNVVAIQLFNAALSSSDLFLDASLTGIEPDLTPPTVAGISPPPGPVTSLSQVTVTFSEPVTGVDASDFLVNGQAVASLTAISSTTYSFSFVQPPVGTVQISWASAHGIQDLGVPQPNPFNSTAAGATWQYQVQDVSPPVILSIVPQPSFTVRSLTQVEVHFSEPVTGVDAGDLRINGTSAAGVSSSDPSDYTFTFPQPPTGSVQVAWTASHGITDLASPPNAFAAGGPWSYTLNPNAPVPDVIITEFLAVNSTWHGSGPLPAGKLADEDGDYPDWIEIYNSSAVEVGLGGWYLTDSASKLTKWSFPATNLPAKAYMVIFASSKDRRIPGRPLHTNFGLSSGGEYLALVRPDGVTLATAFSPTFPPQIDDVSYGFPIASTATTLVSTSSAVTAFVPVNGDLLLDWTTPTFDDSAWLHGINGVGFESPTNPAPSLGAFIATDVQSQMLNHNSSIFIRIPFVVADVSKLDVLTLRLRYNDGFVTYLNGAEVLRVNAPTNVDEGEPLPFDSRATISRSNTASTNAEQFDLSSVVRNGGVQTGTNILAIQGLNSAPDDGNFLISAELTELNRDIQVTQTRYFTTPTPGADNGVGTDNLGPIISDVTPTPQIPGDDDDILITAKVTPTFGPVGQVSLTYRIMFGPEAVIPMLDDGQHGDGAANDGIFGATIPAASLTKPGQMIRWYLRASDTQGRTLRAPSYQDTNNMPQYFGTVVFVPQTNNLPILHWFVQNPGAAATLAGTRASVFYVDQFYDNIAVNIHGQSSQGFPKKSYNIDFNAGYGFQYDSSGRRVGGIDLLTTYADKTHMRNALSYGTYRDAGEVYAFVIPVRVHTNGGFAGEWEFVEKGDDDFLARLGKDPNGALYKMYNTFTDPIAHVIIGPNQAEKKTRKQEGNADLVALMAGSKLAGAARINYIYDNINIPQMINFLAGHIMTADVDCCHKNYYFYRDSNGTGEWEGFPWDVDLSFGRVWNSTDTYWDQILHPDTGLYVGDNNGVFTILLRGTPQTQQMYLRRIRTLMDELLGSPGAPVNHYEPQIDYWLQLVAPDAALDAINWQFASTWGHTLGAAGSPTSTCCTQSMAQAALELKTSYLPQRRTYLYNTIASSLPASQPSNVVIQVRSVDYSPISGNQAQEYIELFNANNFAVDISGWTISSAVDYTFRGGVVIPANTSLYVAQDVKSWRARTNGPTGGQGLFVQGNYKGQLSARGETVILTDTTGRQVNSLTYPGTPSLPQQYLRITEIMYHPTALVGSTNSPEDFEYLELKNIGPVPLNLNGVRFTDGIVFSFTGSAITNLDPGQTVLVVKNLAAFAARYGSGLPVAGQYTGNLDNSGERLRLLDAVGEEILDFSYNNSWYPITDGLGFSLVIIDEQGEPDSWGHKESWRASSRVQGSPGQNEPARYVVLPVLINEALTHSATLPDSIELYNPNTNAVDVSGWYLTDDFGTPSKFRIPNGTVIAAGGYRVFDETQFNTHPGIFPSFALSSDGDEVYVFGAEPGGNLNGYYHGFEFGAAEENVSFGRYITSLGDEHFVRQSALTPGGPNSGPKVGPIVISEIMYHPPDLGTNDNTAGEFVELLNITTNAVPLFDPMYPTNTWKISGGIDFTFPTNVWLASGELLLLVNIAPTNSAALASFRATYNVSTSVQIFGPYGGKLNNGSDKINLKIPTAPLTNRVPVEVPYAIIDRVEYKDRLPWPQAADGFGVSLQRWDARAYGDDPTNWVAAAPSAAALTVTNGTPPQITSQPHSQMWIAGQTGTLTATVTGTEPFSFQWRLNGTNLPGATNLTLTYTNVQGQQTGDYELIILNPLGSVFSQKAHINVRFPLVISQQPQTIDVKVLPDSGAAPTTNVTFSIVVSSGSTVHYQWRRNGSDIPSGTNSTYTVVNVKTNDLSYFSVFVSDDISSAESVTVWLYPWVTPRFIDAPVSQYVVVGGQVTLSAQVTGWPPPFTFTWQRGAAGLVTNVQDEMVSFFTFTAATNVSTNSYRAVIRNRALPGGAATALTSIITLADTDGDGIPDQWESLYGGSPTGLDRFADPDGDGMLNWQEYMAGTNPTNALSSLKITSMVRSNNNLRMEFQAMSNHTYSVQFSPSLDNPNWQNLSRT
ncbi:MAG TPA: lamin tail domain-containing protein, partial [Verrucomicrobiae bacterium]|nr:lamin tail domain-containing protein [Verrucomicrobiae bacterium]